MSDIEIEDDESELSFRDETDDEEDADFEELEEPDLEDVFIYEEEEPEIVGDEASSEDELKKLKYSRGIKSYKEALMRKYADGLIDDTQYFAELLELELFENSEIKELPVTSEGIEFINEIRSNRLLEKQKFIKGEINEQDYNIFYMNSLREEKQAFKDYKASTIGESVAKVDLSKMSTQDKLDYLIKKEDQLTSKLAKKHNITLRKPNSRLASSVDPETRAKYIYDLSVYEDNKSYIMNQYMEGYKVKSLNPTGYTTGKYVIDTPISDSSSLLKFEPKKQLISESDVLEQESKKYMKNLLRKVPRSALLECLRENELLTRETSYIQNLKMNKIPILKFVQFPKDQAELDSILEEELIGKYSVTREIIDSNYTTTTNKVDSIDSNEVVCLPGKDIAIKVPFKGVSRGYIGKTIELILKKGVEGEGLESLGEKFVPVYPVPDPLYNKIVEAGDLEDRVAFVYQLYVPVPGYDKEGVYVTTRYTDFKEYLSDLKNLLAANLLKLESKGFSQYSLAILQSKIQKITHYLNTEEDPDLDIDIDPRSELRSQLIKEKIDEVRDTGKSKLQNFILSINPLAIQKVETLEARINANATEEIPDNGEIITAFKKGTYNYLIDKSVLVLTQYPDMLRDYLHGIILPDIIINFETPLVTPDDFTKEATFKDIPESDKLRQLMEWTPDISMYTQYKEYLNEINSRPIRSGTKLTKLMETANIEKIEAEKIIQEEYEFNSWEEAKREVNSTVKIPPHFTPDLWKFRQLNKKKYSLPSQRIYRVATIRERVDLTKRLTSLFSSCQLQNPTEVSYIVENIIYSKSKLVKDYNKFQNLIVGDYQKFCSYLKEITKDRINIINSIAAITEYFYKEGESLILNKEKVGKIIIGLNSDILLENVLKELSREELEMYRSSLVHVVSPSVTRRFKLLKTVSRLLSIYNNSYNKIATDNAMIYVKPHIELTQPTIGNYIFYNGSYIVGGYYPPYKDERDSSRNYSSDDIRELCTLFGVDYQEDSDDFGNYIAAMRRKNELSVKDVAITIEQPQRELEYKIYKEPVITVQYTLRPRMGVPEPGEVYYTSKDYIKEHRKEYPTNRDYFERNYAVPYTYENFIPVYHTKLKELSEQKLIMLEGPAIFRSPEEDSNANYSTSPYHIFVEYKDTFGKIVYFREGVPQKNVITARKDRLDTCNRFKTMETCNSPNSFSLDSKKCVWNGTVCESSFFRDPLTSGEDIWDYLPDNEEFKVPWSQALLTARNYIKDTAASQNLGEEGITKLLQDQTRRLKEYRAELEKTPIRKPKIDTPLDRSLIEFIESIPKTSKKTLPSLEGYELISIKNVKTELKDRSLTTRELSKFKEFDLSDLGRVEIVSRTGNLVNILSNGEELQIPLSRFRVPNTIPTISVGNLFVYISDLDYNYLKNPPSAFVWKLKTLSIDIDKFTEADELEYETREVNYIDTSMIVPSSELNGIPLITREDIDKAMSNLAFSEYIDVENRLQVENKINATSEAIQLALSENISLFSDSFKFIVREITMEDVVNVIESKRPRAVTMEDALNKQLDKAIKDSDKKEIENTLKQFDRVKIIPKSIELAESKLAEIKERVGSRKIKAHDETISGVKVPDPVKEKDIDVAPKPNKDVSKTVKSFKSRSVVSTRRNI